MISEKLYVHVYIWLVLYNLTSVCTVFLLLIYSFRNGKMQFIIHIFFINNIHFIINTSINVYFEWLAQNNPVH